MLAAASTVGMDGAVIPRSGEGASERRPALAALWAAYAALATVATLLFPPALALFLAPMLAAIGARAPTARASPERLARGLVYVGAFLLAVWPVYLHVKLGPAPILTPPRAVLYALTAVWLYDMAVAPLRRARLLLALRKSLVLTIPFAVLVSLSALSVPFAQGKIVALGEFLRQSIIWTAPCLATLTYVRRERELRLLLVLLVAGAAICGAIALLESGSQTLLATALSPFMADSQWLELVGEQKIRDGVFRAQAVHTHPLSLGEYLAFTFPIALGLGAATRRNARLAFIAAALLIGGGVLATSSRAALLCLLASGAATAIYWTLRMLRRPAARRYLPAAQLVALLLLAASPVIASAGHDLLVGAAGEQAARSSQGRADQIEKTIPKLIERPIFGYGVGRAAIALGYWGNTLTIDNYYLTLALDLGLGGVLAFLALLLGLGRAALGVAKAAPRAAPIYIGLFVAAFGFATTRAVLSMTGNLAIFYLVVAATAGVLAALPKRTR